MGEESHRGRITDDDIEAQRLVIGRYEPNRHREFHSTLSVDAIRNFALCIGSDDPLHVDDDHGRRSRWGSMVAPSIMAAIVNEPLRGERLPKELKAATRGLFKGCQIFMSGGTWTWYRPMRPGDTIYSYEGEESLEVKESEFGGRTVHITRRYVKFNQRAEVVGVYRLLRIIAERSTARKQAKYADLEAASWTPEQIAEIDERYLAEAPRSDEVRWFEDVSLGAAVGPIHKGPLTTTDVMLTHAAGYGFAPQRMLATGRVAAKDRARMPMMYSPNHLGAPDTEARVHWDGELARKVGNPEAYDWGLQREFWLHQALTDFAGDDAFVVRQHDEIRKFNYHGDLQTISGEVTDRRVDDGQPVVDVRVAAVSQRGEETAFAEATIALPSREHGPVVVPEVPADLQREAASFLQQHRRAAG